MNSADADPGIVANERAAVRREWRLGGAGRLDGPAFGGLSALPGAPRAAVAEEGELHAETSVPAAAAHDAPASALRRSGMGCAAAAALVFLLVWIVQRRAAAGTRPERRDG